MLVVPVGESAAAEQPTALQIEEWRLLRDELRADVAAHEECDAWQARRRAVRPEMRDVLHRFLTGAMDVEAFRAIVDQRTRSEWSAFALGGMSGAVFLNRLVRWIPDRDALTAQLRAVLRAPHDPADAFERLHAFVAFLETCARAEGTHAGQLQPGRSAFFASVWWHVDDPEQWPSYQPSAREALRREPPLYRPTSDVAADYLAFRDAFRRLAATLSLTTWELEYLCRWHHERAPREDAERGADAVPARPPRFLRRPIVRAPVLRERRAEPPARRRAGVSHTHLQWLLATMGRRLGCRVWVAANDHHRRWNGERLGDLSVKRLPPLGLHAASQRLVSLIDVVWLRDANQVVAAFEVECTSSIYSGLLRLADLGALSPNLTFPLYIVTPPERVEKVRRELSRPAFQRLGVPERCAFVASTDLIAHAESIMQWATGPDAIARLAQRAGAPPLDELFDDR